MKWSMVQKCTDKSKNPSYYWCEEVLVTSSSRLKKNLPVLRVISVKWSLFPFVGFWVQGPYFLHHWKSKWKKEMNEMINKKAKMEVMKSTEIWSKLSSLSRLSHWISLCKNTAENRLRYYQILQITVCHISSVIFILLISYQKNEESLFFIHNEKQSK